MSRTFAYCLVAVPAVAAIALVSGCGGSTAATTKTGNIPNVQIVKCKTGEIVRSVTIPGNVRAYQEATLYAKVAGYLKTINVDKGDAVKEGALLAELEVSEMLADLARYKAEAEVAEIESQRVTEAQKKAPDLVMPATVDQARGKYAMACAPENEGDPPSLRRAELRRTKKTGERTGRR